MSNNKPLIKVKGKVQDLNKKEKNIKPKQSNFLLTINTNMQYKEDDKHLKDDIEIFDHTINQVLNNVDEYINLPENDKWDDNTIKNVDIDYTIERGLKKGQLHIHIMFKIKHFTKIQLNYNKIKEKICNDLGLKNVYMYNRLLRPNDSDNVEDYINKYI
jgi:light-regulated signal transduction histidine kinase (bacteriophytochrome)